MTCSLEGWAIQTLVETLLDDMRFQVIQIKALQLVSFLNHYIQLTISACNKREVADSHW